MRCVGWFNASCTIAILAALAGLAAPVSAATWDVQDVRQLTTALGQASPGDLILIAPGTYRIGSDRWLSRDGLTLRGASGDPHDVFIDGGGMNSAAYCRTPLHINADHVTIENITVGECYWHAIQISPGADYAVIRNCRTINAGEQHIKGSPQTRGGLIENVWMENTYQRINDGIERPDDYLGGIDLHGAIGWTIRGCVAKNIIGENGNGDAGIFLWNASADCLVENNLIIGCNKGIAFGNPYIASPVPAMDGGIIRNNFIVNLDSAGGDLGIELCYTRNCQVYHNTVYSENANFFRSVQIYASSWVPTQNLQLRNNIIRGWIYSARASGTWSSEGDIVGPDVLPEWFVDPLAGDLHLTRQAVPALGRAVNPTATTDFDGHPRPLGLAGDVGADEYLVGDTNGDGIVNVLDLLRLARAFGATAGDAGYDAAADVNGDGAVNGVDLLLLAESFGL